MVINAASIISRARGSDLVVKIKRAILESEHPNAVNYMRKVDAILQLYRRYKPFDFLHITLFCYLYFDIYNSFLHPAVKSFNISLRYVLCRQLCRC